MSTLESSLLSVLQQHPFQSIINVSTPRLKSSSLFLAFSCVSLASYKHTSPCPHFHMQIHCQCSMECMPLRSNLKLYSLCILHSKWRIEKSDERHRAIIWKNHTKMTTGCVQIRLSNMAIFTFACNTFLKRRE